jgi:hypothetical protein
MNLPRNVIPTGVLYETLAPLPDHLGTIVARQHPVVDLLPISPLLYSCSMPLDSIVSVQIVTHPSATYLENEGIDLAMHLTGKYLVFSPF